MPPNNADLLFGRIAVRNHLVTKAQVDECLALMRRSNDMNLGALLLKKGYIEEKHYRAILAKVERLQAREAAEKKEAPSHIPKDPGDVRTVKDVERMDFSRLEGSPIDEYLKLARDLGASDLHYQVDAPPYIRLHGSIIYLKHPILQPEETERRILDLLAEREQEMFAERNDLDLCIQRDHGRYRTNVLRQRKGIDAVFRIIPSKIPTLEELNLPPILRQFTTYRQGIVLITGPSGCGKSATMAALIDIINMEHNDHIVTCEDPIEYVFESKRCNVNQRHVRVHTENFATSLRSAMRGDPDVIMVGEMRDLETISMAITAAETGHLVMGTLHTTNAMRSIDRIIDVFPGKEQEQIRAMVSESMRGVISQQLIPRADGRGRVPALEIMFATPAVGNLIRERKTYQLISVLQTGGRQGMRIMDDSIGELLKAKLITLEQAKYHAELPERFASESR